MAKTVPVVMYILDEQVTVGEALIHTDGRIEINLTREEVARKMAIAKASHFSIIKEGNNGPS